MTPTNYNYNCNNGQLFIKFITLILIRNDIQYSLTLLMT